MTVQRLQRFLALVFLGLIGVLPAGPAAAEPLPMPRVVGPAGPPSPLAVEEYLTPPKEILDAVLATRSQNVLLTNISPDGKKFLVTKTEGLPPISRLVSTTGATQLSCTMARSRSVSCRSKRPA